MQRNAVAGDRSRPFGKDLRQADQPERAERNRPAHRRTLRDQNRHERRRSTRRSLYTDSFSLVPSTNAHDRHRPAGGQKKASRRSGSDCSVGRVYAPWGTREERFDAESAQAPQTTSRTFLKHRPCQDAYASDSYAMPSERGTTTLMQRLHFPTPVRQIAAALSPLCTSPFETHFRIPNLRLG